RRRESCCRPPAIRGWPFAARPVLPGLPPEPCVIGPHGSRPQLALRGSAQEAMATRRSCGNNRVAGNARGKYFLVRRARLTGRGRGVNGQKGAHVCGERGGRHRGAKRTLAPSGRAQKPSKINCSPRRKWILKWLGIPQTGGRCSEPRRSKRVRVRPAGRAVA